MKTKIKSQLKRIKLSIEIPSEVDINQDASFLALYFSGSSTATEETLPINLKLVNKTLYDRIPGYRLMDTSVPIEFKDRQDEFHFYFSSDNTGITTEVKSELGSSGIQDGAIKITSQLQIIPSQNVTQIPYIGSFTDYDLSATAAKIRGTPVSLNYDNFANHLFYFSNNTFFLLLNPSQIKIIRKRGLSSFERHIEEKMNSRFGNLRGKWKTQK